MNGAELSLWDRFKIAITPKSHAEAIVDSMYSPENRGMAGLPGFSPLPEFEPESAGTPAFVVETKQAAVRTIAAAAAPFKQFATGAKSFVLIAFAGIVALVIIYALVTGFARRF